MHTVFLGSKMQTGFYISSVDTSVSTSVGMGMGGQIAHVRDLKERDLNLKYII
jgi:hypothetical protein